jgi:hypothetical protein
MKTGLDSINRVNNAKWLWFISAYSLIFFGVQCFDVRGVVRFSWYWRKYWQSLLQLSFHKVFKKVRYHISLKYILCLLWKWRRHNTIYDSLENIVP